MADDDRTSRLRHGDDLWVTLTGILDAHLREPIGPSTDWSGHDVYAHFARWQENAAATLRRLAVGQAALAIDGAENDINERWRAADRSLDTDIVRARCEATRAELRAALLAFSAEQWSQFGRHISAEDITGEHYTHHLADAGVPA